MGSVAGPARSRVDTDVVIVGAGPYGLSLAAHLAEAGIAHRVFGRPMSYWRERMPAGMFLRSSWDASHIGSPNASLSLDAYQAEMRSSIPRPIPLATFVEYGAWFKTRAAPDLDDRMVECAEEDGDAFRVSLEDGQQLRCRRVIVATGLDCFASIPEVFAGIAPLRRVHASDLAEPAQMAGRRVAVIGGGQSALETAALLKEAGAEVQVLVRESHIHWLRRSMKLHQKEGMVRRLLYPKTDVGPPILNQIVARPRVWRQLPRPLGERVAYRSIRPAGAGWLIARLRDVPIQLACTVESVEDGPDGVVIEPRNGSRIEVEVLVLGTGYRIDTARYSFISRNLLRRIQTRNGYPLLNRGFESSAPGVHFVGAPSAASFGPLMRFVSGTPFTARTLTEHLRSAAR